MTISCVALTAWFEVLNNDITFYRELLHQSAGEYLGAFLDRVYSPLYSLSSFQLAKINGHTLLVSTDASKPRTRAIFIELPPYSKRIAGPWCLNFDDLGPELAEECWFIKVRLSTGRSRQYETTHPSNWPAKGPAISCPISRTRTPARGRSFSGSDEPLAEEDLKMKVVN